MQSKGWQALKAVVDGEIRALELTAVGSKTTVARAVGADARSDHRDSDTASQCSPTSRILLAGMTFGNMLG